ncbi:MAG: hypothetical protein J2P17_18995 [Mycobacterium sp.]|nr:hypothetical protein [Mycobacterium sp.]
MAEAVDPSASADPGELKMCDLLPAGTVSAAFHVAGMTAQSASGDDGSCAYNAPTTGTSVLNLSASVTREQEAESPSQLATADTTGECEGQQSVSGIADVAIVCTAGPSNSLSWIFVAVKKAGNDMYLVSQRR